MRLLGKYAFDKLRDCFQGVFEFYMTSDDKNLCYILELWQIRFIIYEPINGGNCSLELSINAGEKKGYHTFGKIELTK